MNAPAQTAAVAINQTIAIDMLNPSPTNPRKRFDEAKLNELAESIKAQGLLQPLLVRERAAPKKPADAWPFPTKGEPDNRPHFEIIAGERRYRAAKLAGLTELPCFVRELTDLQVLHAQVIENLQHDDLHPLEEAEGYQRLIELGSKAEDLGTEIGKSRAYVYARLKLLDLCAESRDAFFKGKLEASTALLIARIPTDKLQMQALKEITHPRFGDEAMSYRDAKRHIQDHYMLDLDKAPWSPKDADLLPKAGACATCPKLTGNQPDLFDDVKSKNVCTDTVCFAMKKTAHVLQLQKQATAEGHKVIAGKEALKMIPDQYYGDYSLNTQLQKHGVIRLSDAIPNDPKGTTWEKALIKHKLLAPVEGKPPVQKVIIEDPHHKGEIIQTVSIEDATKALRQAGFEIKLKGSASAESKTDKQRLEKEKAVIAPENAFRTKLFDELRASISADLAAGAMRQELFLVLAERSVSDCNYSNDTVKGLIARHAPDLATLPNHDERFAAFAKRLPELSAAQHFLIVFEMEMESELDVDIWALKREEGKTPQTMLRIAQVQGIDADAIRTAAVAEHDATAKKSAAKKPEAKKASTTQKSAKAA